MARGGQGAAVLLQLINKAKLQLQAKPSKNLANIN